MTQDVSSPIDLRLMAHAREWEATAMLKRPWREDFFACFATEIASAAHPVSRVLELGSGPGFLAKHLLVTFDSIDYVALDFSAAMHHLAAQRLGGLASRVKFVKRSFRENNWPVGLGKFQCVVTNQAVHELRHKHHATKLHEQAIKILTPSGFYLVCDHFYGKGGMDNNQLYMSVDEQREALFTAGFTRVDPILIKGGLVLHRAA